MWKTLIRAVDEFFKDDCTTLAAALAYYAVFSLPPLLFLIATLVGSLMGWEQVEARLFESIHEVTGPIVSSHLRDELHAVAQRLRPDGVMIVWAGGLLVFAATGVLVQLQGAINRAWAVRPDPRRGFVRNFLAKRALSMLMVLVLSVAMLALIILSTAVTAAGTTVSDRLPPLYSQPVLRALDVASGLIISFAILAAVFRIVPDAKVEWRDVWVGAGVTAVLMTVGRAGVGIYLGSRDLGDMFGPAAALAVLLLWVYYSAMIVLFGAEFTHCWASRGGRRIVPDDGAVAVIKAQVATPQPDPEGSARA